MSHFTNYQWLHLKILTSYLQFESTHEKIDASQTSKE